MEIKSVHEFVRQLEKNDKFGTTIYSKYVQFSMREDIDTTEAYINSRFTTGPKDNLGRDKPFYNIVVAARNIWYRATDIDRKNIFIRATKEKDEIAALLATIKLQEWMRKNNFGQFLNDWGLTLATHGSAITKFVEANGELHCQVMDWNTMIVDPIDFENNPKIEKLWYTPAQLKRNKNYNKDLVDKLIDNVQTRKTMGGQQVDNRQGYIPVYEVHGELSLAQYKMSKGEPVEEGDEDEFFQQMHVISFLENPGDKASFDEYTLYSGKEARDPYLLTHLIKKDGQTYSGGAVKNLFEAQWMVNDTQKKIKDQLDLASKIIFQTADDSFAGQNALVNVENGDIMTYDAQKGPLSQINNKPDIAAMQATLQAWQTVANQINGISEAMMGQNPPSGTAWRQTEALLQESHSLFSIMTQNKGLALTEMLTTFVIPFFKKQLNNTDEIAAILEDHQITQIDSRYVPNEVTRRLNEKKKKTILSGAIYDPTTEGQDRTALEQAVKGNLNGNQRFIKPSDIPSKTWKDVFKDLEWELDIDVTGEGKDTQTLMTTLTTILKTIASNPGILQDPNARLVFNRILDISGAVSPLELQVAQSQPAKQMQPQQQPNPMQQMQPQPA